MQYDEKLHALLLEEGRKIEKTTTHKLEPEMIEGIIATVEYFEPTPYQRSTLYLDLVIAKYKIFDWLGMWLSGRCEDVRDPVATQRIYSVIEKLAVHYIAMKNVGGWAWSLRGHLDLEACDKKDCDYYCQDCIDSYEEWHKMTPEQRLREQKERERLYGGVIGV